MRSNTIADVETWRCRCFGPALPQKGMAMGGRRTCADADADGKKYLECGYAESYCVEVRRAGEQRFKSPIA